MAVQLETKVPVPVVWGTNVEEVLPTEKIRGLLGTKCAITTVSQIYLCYLFIHCEYLMTIYMISVGTNNQMWTVKFLTIK